MKEDRLYKLNFFKETQNKISSSIKKMKIYKKKLSRIYILISVLAVVSISSVLCIEQSAEQPADKSYYPKLNFAISLLNLLQKNKPNKNVFYSPKNVYRALLLTYFCAAGKTKKELGNVLGNQTEIENVYKLEEDTQVKAFQNTSVEFNSVSKLYFSDRVNIK